MFTCIVEAIQIKGTACIVYLTQTIDSGSENMVVTTWLEVVYVAYKNHVTSIENHVIDKP